MDEKQLKYLWDNYANGKGFKDFNEFKSLMSDSSSRKLFFDDSNKSLGFKDYDEFENILGLKKKGVSLAAVGTRVGKGRPETTEEILQRIGGSEKQYEPSQVDLDEIDEEITDPVKYVEDEVLKNTIRYGQVKSESTAQNVSQPIDAKTQTGLNQKQAKKVFDTARKELLPDAKTARKWVFEKKNGNLDSSNKTDQLAAGLIEQYERTKANILSSASLEEAALKDIMDKGGLTAKQTAVLGGDIPPAMKGKLLLNYLNRDDVREVAGDIQDVNSSLRQTLWDLPQKYPEAAVSVLSEKISQKREESGYNNAILNLPSMETNDKVVDELIESGELPLQYKYLYEKPEVRFLVNSNLKTPGLLENFGQGLERGLMGMGKSVASIHVPGVGSIRDIYSSDEEQLSKALEEQYSEFSFKPKGLLKEITTSGGDILGQVSSIVLGGGLLKASGLVKNEKAANMLMTGLQSFGYNVDNAKIEFPDDERKQYAYALMNTGIEVSLANVFNDMKFARELTGKVTPKIKDVITRFTNKEISESAAKKSVMEISKDILIDVYKFGKSIPVTANKEALEEGLTAGLQTVSNQVFGGESYKERDALQEAFDVYRTTFLGSLLLGIGGGISSLRKDMTMPDLIYEMASAPSKYRGIIQYEALRDKEYAETAQEKLNNLTYIKKVKDDLDKQDLTEKQKKEMLHASLVQKVQQDKADAVTEPTLKKIEQEKVKLIEAQKEDILTQETSYQNILNEIIESGILSKESETMARQDPEGFLKFVAQQSNNFTQDGNYDPDWDATGATIRNYGQTIVNMANEVFPEYAEKRKRIQDETRDYEIEQRKKKYAPPDERQERVNKFADDVRKFNELPKGQMGKNKPENQRERNRLALEANELGLKFKLGNDGYITTDAKIKDSSNSNLAIDEKFKPIEERSDKMQTMWADFKDILADENFSFEEFIPNDIVGADGKRMDKEQLNKAMRDIRMGVPSKGANKLLDALEYMADNDVVEIRDGERLVQVPLSEYLEYYKDYQSDTTNEEIDSYEKDTSETERTPEDEGFEAVRTDEDGNEDVSPESTESDEGTFSEEPATGVFAETEQRESADGRLKPIDFPELVQLAKELTGGKYAGVKSLAKFLGYFSPKLKNIVLNKTLFSKENYADLLKTMSHEIGHLVDYLPDETMQKGNILGRIASIKGFMESVLPFKPGDPGKLTQEEIDRIEADVKAAFTRIREIDETIEKEIGVTPQDVLDIWNSIDAGRNNPKLLEYIQGLTDAEKKSIVLQAMKGGVADALKQFSKKTKEKTGKRVIEEFLLKGWRKEIKRRVDEEIAKRRLWSEKVIFDEAYNLSKQWRPFNEEGATKSQIAYRRSAKEVYADMISVLLNSPGELEQKAPMFFQAFMNYLDAKPEFKAVYNDLMNLLTDPKMVREARVEKTKEGFRAAEEKRGEALKIKKRNNSFKKYFARQVLSENSPLLSRLPKEKQGSDFSLYEKMRNELEKMAMWKSKATELLDRYTNELFIPLEKNDISVEDIGALTQYFRNISPGRADKANPLGFQTEEANLDAVQSILDNYTEEQQKVIEDTLKKFYEINFDVMQDAYDSGLITPEMWQEIQKNKYNYATFKPVNYIDDRVQTAAFLNIKGGLGEIANPFVETMLKAVMVQRAATKNRAMLMARDMLKDLDPDSIREEELDFRGMPPRPKTGEDAVIYKEGGKGKVFVTDEHTANIFNTLAPEEINLIAKVSNLVSVPLKAMWTRYNVSFVFFTNVIKDSLRTAGNINAILHANKQLKWYDYIKNRFVDYPKAWFSSVKKAAKILNKKPGELGAEMLKGGAINPESALFANFNPEYSGLVNMLTHYDNFSKHLGTEKQEKKLYKKIWDAIWWLPETLLTKPGQVIEMTTKVAGYKLLRKKLGAEMAAYYTRNFVGTPNYSERTGYNYGWIPFGKVIMQGLRNDAQLATRPETRTAYWIDKMAFVIVPALLAGAAKVGLFDDEEDEKGRKLSDWFRKFGHYNRNNFYIVPLGFTEDGKARGLTMPMDDVSNLIYQLVMNGFEDGEMSDHFKNMTESLITKTPIMNIFTPSEVPMAWWKYLIKGQNPTDDYFNRNIIRDKNFEAGGSYAMSDMMKWTANKFSFRLPYHDASQKTFKEQLLAIAPIARKIYKETAIGEYEEIKEAKDDLKKQQAVRIIKIDDAVKGAVEKQMEDLEAGADGRKRIEKEGNVIKEMVMDAFKSYTGKEKPTNEQEAKDLKTIVAKVKISINRNIAAGMPYAQAVVNANSNDEKELMMDQAKENLSESEFNELVKLLKDNEIFFYRK